MRPVAALWLLTLALASTQAAGQERALVEQAWAVMDSSAKTAEVYVVINNARMSGVRLEGARSADAVETTLLDSVGRPMPEGAFIPQHAELYMMPGGIHFRLQGLSEGTISALRLTLLIDGGEEVVDVPILAPGAEPPDHHDFQH